MKAEDYHELDKLITKKIFEEQGDEEWTEECQTCHGTGQLVMNSRTYLTTPCWNCEGEGYITYSNE